MGWLKENWFKLGVLFVAIITVGVYGSYLSKKNSIEIQKQVLESQKQEQINEQEQQKAETDAHINQCITDAYTELKTLQENMEDMKIYLCTLGNCDINYWNNAKNEAFDSYQNEWLPQCKLGNRVFIHYEPTHYNN